MKALLLGFAALASLATAPAFAQTLGDITLPLPFHSGANASISGTVNDYQTLKNDVPYADSVLSVTIADVNKTFSFPSGGFFLYSGTVGSGTLLDSDTTGYYHNKAWFFSVADVLPTGNYYVELMGAVSSGSLTASYSVNVDQAGAPEPSTWAMMGLGFAGLGLAGYRKSRKRAALAA